MLKNKNVDAFVSFYQFVLQIVESTIRSHTIYIGVILLFMYVWYMYLHQQVHEKGPEWMKKTRKVIDWSNSFPFIWKQ